MSSQLQVSFVQSLLEQRMRRLPVSAFSVMDFRSKKTNFATHPKNIVSLSKTWQMISNWVSARQIFPSRLDVDSISQVIDAVSRASFVQTSIPHKGTQLKVSVQLEGLQKALFKPKRYEINHTVPAETAYGGADRHNGEIAAFYLGALLQLNRIPLVVGRSVKVREEVMDISTSELNHTFFSNTTNGRLCFYGKCMYCKREEAVCENKDGLLDGALVLWLPNNFVNLEKIRSPWARTYKANKLAAWQTDSGYCEKVRQHKFFGESPIYLDLMDMAVFDYLIGNADRHRLEYFANGNPKMILLLDNGKSFGNANNDELTILAPIYQCCQVRQKLYETLMRYSELNIGQLLDEQLIHDPLYPVVTKNHLEAINRRLRKVLNLLATCIEQHGISYVLQNDGY